MQNHPLATPWPLEQQQVDVAKARALEALEAELPVDDDLPGMWEHADFEGGREVRRGPELPVDEVEDDITVDFDAELEALFAGGFGRKNRATRRREAKNRTRYVTNWRGRRLSWKPTQTPTPLRIARNRRRAKAARRARRLNRRA